METYVLGADCGGTSSRVVVATLDGRVAGRGRGGAGNPVARDARAAAAELGAAAAQALAGLDPARVAGVVVGMAGRSRLADPATAAAYDAVWAGLGVTCAVRAVGDAVVAYAAGTPEPSGSVLIAGTGAVGAAIEGWAVARTADGLGWLLGDEGSGFWLGLSAARAAARALYAGEAAGPLVAAVCAELGATDPDALVSTVYAVPRDRISALAAVVVATARAGDPEGLAILADAADRLARTLVSLRPGPGPVVLAGGLLAGVPEIRDGVQARLAALLGRPGVVGTDGAAAAAWLAGREIIGGDGAGLHASLLGREALSTRDEA
ncbi:N-acetylglucosamine kinase [Spirilliplanes yamanashiensis]|uniref:N-acetylglucosamine kinase n=1 Tax=Spirilliplanes yamanashiensis TaxID=42233 RepID=A0A8J4DHC8_9ACTN|nr:BadF/BadG/BcrA/BcrD ATPase family protein [Spirilliplanes yamanashiensis]MDP9819154.1 N-acetylglucosamine kinase-like BadF-type ATPase [Spirilliplanes yamanashiensis]GIJ02022.1 N-acetylglucosamine kinase [Spirilliplanes yamanashiensis]